MLLAHRIRLDPTADQRDYFARAAGTARRVWNWALAEWQRQVAAGGKPNAMLLKKQFNAIKYAHPDWLDAEGQAWLRTVHRDAHAQPFAHLARAWSRYFLQRRAGQPAHPPRFKKKGRCCDAFYVANDKFRFEDGHVVLPKVGRVALREALRWPGKILGASVSREADHWFLSVQVDVPQQAACLRRSGDGVTGVDLGVSSAATLSSGEKIAGPRPLKTALRRLRIRSRRQSRKLEAAKAAAGIGGAVPKGTRLPKSKNWIKGTRALARLQARIARVRRDFTHKLTARLCRENQAVVIEDLNVRACLPTTGWRARSPTSGFMRSGASCSTRRFATAARSRWPTAGTRRASCARGAGHATASWSWPNASGPASAVAHATTAMSTRP